MYKNSMSELQLSQYNNGQNQGGFHYNRDHSKPGKSELDPSYSNLNT